MRITSPSIQQIATLTHDGKVLLFGVTPSNAIYYSVKRSGFEDTALSPEADPFELLPKLEVRYRRSQQRLVPQQSATSTSGANFDNLDYRDINGNSFF